MKTALRFALSALLLALTCAVVAQPAVAEEARPGAGNLEQLARELNLTDEQKAAIGPILRKQAEDFRALQADTSLRRMQKMRRAKEINEKASTAIRAHLTAEQQKKYEELRAEMRAQMKERIKERKSQSGGS